MKLRTKYILFISLIHLVTLVLTFFIFKERKLLFIASEVVILLSLYFAYRLYMTMVQPLNFIATGVDAIRDRDFNVKFQPVGQVELDNLIDVYNEMIDQLRMERTKQAQQHFFLDKLIQTSPTGIIILDYDGNVANCNPKARALLHLGEDQVMGFSIDALEGPLPKALSRLPENESKTVEITGIETYKCHKAHFIDRGFPLHFITIEELTAEKLLIEKQAYGKVIRMMAHEVNNSIGPINSILDSLLKYESQINAKAQSTFHEVITVAKERNLKLNRFMRNFADVVKLPQPKRENHDLCRLAQDVLTLLEHQAKGKAIQLELKKQSTEVITSIDLQQIEQVLINVVKNAIEAIEKQGQIIVEVNATPLQIRVLDNGIGIAEEEAARLFSPFFSTKAEGQGVGLTLTREILLNHGFEFSLRMKDGWTVFEINF